MTGGNGHFNYTNEQSRVWVSSILNLALFDEKTASKGHEQREKQRRSELMLTVDQLSPVREGGKGP